MKKLIKDVTPLVKKLKVGNTITLNCNNNNNVFVSNKLSIEFNGLDLSIITGSNNSIIITKLSTRNKINENYHLQTLNDMYKY